LDALAFADGSKSPGSKLKSVKQQRDSQIVARERRLCFSLAIRFI